MRDAHGGVDVSAAHDTPATMAATLSFERIARSEHVSTTIECTADTDLEGVVREFAGRFLRSPRFEVEIREDGRVLISSGKPGFPEGDFGKGQLTWAVPS